MPTAISIMGSHPFQGAREQGAQSERRDDGHQVDSVDHVCFTSMGSRSALRREKRKVLPAPSRLSARMTPGEASTRVANLMAGVA